MMHANFVFKTLYNNPFWMFICSYKMFYKRVQSGFFICITRRRLDYFSSICFGTSWARSIENGILINSSNIRNCLRYFISYCFTAKAFKIKDQSIT